MRTSLFFPVQPQQGSDARHYAELVRSGAAHRLWLGNSMVVEAQQCLAFLAGGGYRIPVGTSVQLTPLRHPLEAAVEARSLALLTGRSVVAGFGASSAAFASYLRGAPYERPASAVRDYLARMRAFLDGADGVLPPADHPPVQLAAGVLRPGMARAAAEVADAAVTWMTPPAYISQSLVPALDQGAGGPGRRPHLATVVHVALDRPGRDPVEMAHRAAAAHLVQPHYADMLRRAGLHIDTQDPRAGARSLVENGVFATGSPGEIAEHLRAYERAGVDEIILNTAGVCASEGLDSATIDAAEILAALAASPDPLPGMGAAGGPIPP